MNSASAVSVHPYLADVRFLYRGRLTGSIDFICPFCGFLTRTYIRPQTHIVRCNFENCRRMIGIGHIAYVLPPGTKHLPADYVIPTSVGMWDAFPGGEVDTWSNGQLRHIVTPLDCHHALGHPPPIPIDAT